MSSELKGNIKDFGTLFGVALDLKKMFLGLAGLIFSTAIIYGISYFIGWNNLKNLSKDGYAEKIWISKDTPLGIKDHHQIIIHGFEIVFHQRCKHLLPEYRGKINTDLTFGNVRSPFVKRINRLIPYIFGVFYFILFNIVWGYFGLGICRVAALNLAKDEIVATKHIFEYTTKKYRDASMALILCVVIFLVFAGCNIIGGLVGAIPLNYLLTIALGGLIFYFIWTKGIKNSLFPTKEDEPESFSQLLIKFFVGLAVLVVIEVITIYIFSFVWYGWNKLLNYDNARGVGRFFLRLISLNYPLDFLVTLLTPLALISGFVMAILFVGTILGYPLMYPTVAVEGTEVYDAASRSIMYVLTRPIHYIIYQLATIVTGIVSFAIVGFFGYLTLKLGLFSAGILFSFRLPYDKLSNILNYISGKGATVPMSANEYLSMLFLGFWLFLVIGVIFSYIISYFWSAQTLVYLLLRKEVDGIEISEIYEEPTDKPWEKEPEVEVYEPQTAEASSKTSTEQSQTQQPPSEQSPTSA